MAIQNRYDSPNYNVTTNYNNNVTVNYDPDKNSDCGCQNDDYDSYGNNNGNTFTPNQINKFIDMLPLPQMFKMRLKDFLNGGDDGYRNFQNQVNYKVTLQNGTLTTDPSPLNTNTYTARGVSPDSFLDLVMKGTLSSTNRPNEYKAANDLFNFMKANGIPLMNLPQLQNILNNNQCLLPNGTFLSATPDLQSAADRFLANDNSLYLKLEMEMQMKGDQFNSSFNNLFRGVTNNGIGDLLSNPQAQNAGKSVTDFMKDNNIDLLSKEQMQELAEKGKVTLGDGTVIIGSDDLKASAQKLMENGGALFDELEAGNTGQKDGLLGQLDFDKAMQNGFGEGLSSAADATQSIYKFIAGNNIDKLTKDQMQEIANTGKCTLPNGQVITVPPDVQQAARKLMDNGGALFDQIESADDGKKDGILGARDGFVAAIKKGLIPLPSADDAASGVQDFLKRNNIDLLSKDQIKELAETGQVTVNGKVIKGDPKDQLAAMKLMENNGALFDQLEAANTGQKDGLLGQSDFPASVKKGMLNDVRETNNDLPAPALAFKLIDDFLGKNNISLLNKDQVKEMAETGHLKLPDGKIIDVSPQEQQAARRLMEDNYALFDVLETHKGKKDGLIGQKDYEIAVKNGTYGQ